MAGIDGPAAFIDRRIVAEPFDASLETIMMPAAERLQRPGRESREVSNAMSVNDRLDVIDDSRWLDLSLLRAHNAHRLAGKLIGTSVLPQDQAIPVTPWQRVRVAARAGYKRQHT
jgi:hypothetical protein